MTSPSLPPEQVLAALLRVLRGRPSTLTALREVVAGEPAGVLEVLLSQGFVHVDGDTVDVVPPDAALGQVVAAALATQRTALGEITRLVDALPALSRAWERGATPGSFSIRGEVVEGDDRAMQRWFALTQQRPPVSPGNAFGDFRFVRRQFPPHSSALRDAFAQARYTLRVLVPAGQAADPDNRAVVDEMTEVGVQVRLATTVPSWLYVDKGVMVGLPNTWGAGSPTDLVVFYDDAVIAPISCLFESWWSAATPWPLTPQGWVPVLQLLGRGLSDEQVATVLDVGLRTVRRRIAEAMAAYAVASRFELGAAWARSGGRPPGG